MELNKPGVATAGANEPRGRQIPVPARQVVPSGPARLGNCPNVGMST